MNGKLEDNPCQDAEKRLAWRLACGQGDLIYAITMLVFMIAVLRALIM